MAQAKVRSWHVVALLFMLLGMAGTASIAQPTSAHHELTALNGCDERGERHGTPVSKSDCQGMCSAVATTTTPLPTPAAIVTAPRTLAPAAPFAGIEPEISTPPPKRS